MTTNARHFSPTAIAAALLQLAALTAHAQDRLERVEITG